ncbi:hypothetical protein JZU69_04820 [bacterium]|nr:hypothetical protein [bacterium]
MLHVKRRLKLASVAPELLEEFRKGEINLDQVMALAGCEDQERQVQIWKSLPTYQRSDQCIRRKIAEDEVEPDDDRLKLVTVDEYIAAGGAVDMAALHARSSHGFPLPLVDQSSLAATRGLLRRLRCQNCRAFDNFFAFLVRVLVVVQ